MSRKIYEWLCSARGFCILVHFSAVLPRVRTTQDVNNRWKRWSENQSINRWQSMQINRLISTIVEQSMLEFYVIINFIDYQFLSIINTNRSVHLHRLSSIGCHFLCVLSSVKISKTRSLYASNNDENCDKTLIFSQRWTWVNDFIEPSRNGKE